MNVIVKCWTPEHYDSVSHAIIPFTIERIDKLLAQLKMAYEIKETQFDFMGLEFDDYQPTFIDLGDPEDLGFEDDKLDDGYHILSEKIDVHNFAVISMRPCCLMVMAGDIVADVEPNGRVYWYGYDKHGDAGCRAETYSLSEEELRDIRKDLECQSTLSK